VHGGDEADRLLLLGYCSSTETGLNLAIVLLILQNNLMNSFDKNYLSS
jgi:hypothetical protein